MVLCLRASLSEPYGFRAAAQPQLHSQSPLAGSHMLKQPAPGQSEGGQGTLVGRQFPEALQVPDPAGAQGLPGVQDIPSTFRVQGSVCVLVVEPQDPL